MELKGLTRAEQQALLDEYEARTGSRLSLPAAKAAFPLSVSAMPGINMAELGKNLRVDMSGLAFPSRRAAPAATPPASSASADSPAAVDVPDAAKKSAVNFGALFGVGSSSHRRGPSTDASGAVAGAASSSGSDALGAPGTIEPVNHLDAAIDKGLDKAKAAFAKFGNIFGAKP